MLLSLEQVPLNMLTDKTIKEWLSVKAKNNKRSIAAEVNIILEAAFAAEQAENA